MVESKEKTLVVAGATADPGVADLVAKLEALGKRVVVLEGSVLPKELSALASRVLIIERSPAVADYPGLQDLLQEISGRLEKLEEEKPALEVKTKQPRTVDELHRAELATLEDDPEARIQTKMAFGLSRDKAELAVQKRIGFLRSQLPAKAPEKNRGKAGKVAAMLFLLLSLCGLVAPQARADSQGFPSTFVVDTNLPQWPLTLTNKNASVTNTVGYSLGSQATNYIPLRANSGLGVQSIFAAPPGYLTNLTGGESILFFPSVDGTNAINTSPWATITAPCNITNAVIFGTNWNQLQLRGYAGMFYCVSNGCSDQIVVGGSITNVQNGATNVIPAGVTFNRPNQ